MTAVATKPAAAAAARIIESMDQVPQHLSNLCKKGGLLELRDEDASIVALLDLGEQQVVCLWAGEQTQVPTLVGVKTAAQSRGYTVRDTLRATRDVIASCSEGRDVEEAEEELENTQAIRTFDDIIAQAVAKGASDVHISPTRRHAIIRYRINGELVEAKRMPAKQVEFMVRAMYSQADVDSRRSQPTFSPDLYLDASLQRRVEVNGKFEELKLRWASGPVWPDSFDVALRLLHVGQETVSRSLDALGYTKEQESLLVDALRQPSGLILLCGTTGAGKSTTCATLAELWGNRYQGTRMLRSLEDPPEYVIAGARQMPVSRKDAQSKGDEEGFHRALRAAMRMDPDALFLGEVRDAITADLLQQLVLTGHKAFATLHGGSVFAAIGRLQELGVSLSRLASEGFINAIVHQHLVPVLCPHCARAYSAEEVGVALHAQYQEDLGEANLATAKVRGDGCEHCTNGLRGRTALASILTPDAGFRQLLRSGDDAGAMAYWRSGRSASHGGVQARTQVAQAVELIRQGVLSPVDADLALGRLRDEPVVRP